MGQKVNPTGFRLGSYKVWDSLWYAKKTDYAKKVATDYYIRSYITSHYKGAAITKIIIASRANQLMVTLHSGKAGVLLAKRGSGVRGVDEIKSHLTKKLEIAVEVNVLEIKKSELNAMAIAANIAGQLEKRMSYKQAMKRSVSNAMRMGAVGIKVCVSGRLAGVEIARSEWIMEGRVPLHTLRANIFYGVAEAKTTYGIIGIKVWVHNKADFVEV